MRILLVEDNDTLAGLICESLKEAGFGVDHVTLADEALAALSVSSYSIVILDLGLPDDDGLHVLDHMRRHNDSTSVLVLTARDGLSDRVDGLNRGADDYMLKPFEMVELIARIRTLLRRPGASVDFVLEIGNVEFDTMTRDIKVGGDPIVFTPRERDVFEYLVRRAGNVTTKGMLEDALYGFGEAGGANSIEVAIHRLRKILSNAGADVEIHTLRGVGYLLAEKPHEKITQACS